jgi:hypothetical protein
MFAWDEKGRKKASGSAEIRLLMYRRELIERAELLRGLGRSAKFTKMRLLGNMSWEFDLHGRPKHAADVERIVDEVYRKAGSSR